MKKSEALDIIKRKRNDFKRFQAAKEIIEAFDVVIKCAEENNKESCEDCVSIQAVLDKAELIELDDGQSFMSIDPEDVKALSHVTQIELQEQEPILDKIRAEIEDLTYYCCEVHPRTVIDDVLKIIDKYKAESEEHLKPAVKRGLEYAEENNNEEVKEKILYDLEHPDLQNEKRYGFEGGLMYAREVIEKYL